MFTPDFPLKLSAAGFRFAGYMVESNLRVAKVLGEAAFKTGPFSKPLSAKSAEPQRAPRPARAKPAAAKRVAPAKQAQAAHTPAPAPVKAEAPAKTAPPVASPASRAAAKPSPKAASPAPKTAHPVVKATPEPASNKAYRKPSMPPAMPTKAKKSKSK